MTEDSREDDIPELNVRDLRRWHIGTSAIAVIIALVTSIGGIAYEAIAVQLQTAEHSKEIQEIQTTQASLWAKRDADRDVFDKRLQSIEEHIFEIDGELRSRKLHGR
jgi:hypothetical protein